LSSETVKSIRHQEHRKPVFRIQRDRKAQKKQQPFPHLLACTILRGDDAARGARSRGRKGILTLLARTTGAHATPIKHGIPGPQGADPFRCRSIARAMMRRTVRQQMLGHATTEKLRLGCMERQDRTR
jgi:hypothetical protein